MRSVMRFFMHLILLTAVSVSTAVPIVADFRATIAIAALDSVAVPTARSFTRVTAWDASVSSAVVEVRREMDRLLSI